MAGKETAIDEQVTCSRCNLTFVPSFFCDYYKDENDPSLVVCETCVIAGVRARVMAEKAPLPVPFGYEKTVCKVGEGSTTCRFCAASNGAYTCTKGTYIEATIRARADGSEPMTAQGDNCSGPPNFSKH